MIFGTRTGKKQQTESGKSLNYARFPVVSKKTLIGQIILHS